MNEQNAWTELRQHWDRSAKNDVDYTTDAERAHLQAVKSAHESLEKLGWKNIIYCPKDGTHFLSISAGHSSVSVCHYSGEWPTGHWWISEAGDQWPAHPILWKPIPAQP